MEKPTPHYPALSHVVAAISIVVEQARSTISTFAGAEPISSRPRMVRLPTIVLSNVAHTVPPPPPRLGCMLLNLT